MKMTTRTIKLLMIFMLFCVSTFSQNIEHKLKIRSSLVYVEDKGDLWLIDTGSSINLVHMFAYEGDVAVEGISGKTKVGYAFNIYILERKTKARFMNLSNLMDALGVNIKGIIGTKFLNKNNAVINYNEKHLILN